MVPLCGTKSSWVRFSSNHLPFPFRPNLNCHTRAALFIVDAGRDSPARENLTQRRTRSFPRTCTRESERRMLLMRVSPSALSCLCYGVKNCSSAVHWCHPVRERASTALPSSPLRRDSVRVKLLLKRLSQTPDLPAAFSLLRSEEPPPAARVLPGLVMVCIQLVTSLGGFHLRSSFVCACLPAGHSFHSHEANDFSGTNLEASAYPSKEDVRFSAPSPIELTPKRLRAFHG